MGFVTRARLYSLLRNYLLRNEPEVRFLYFIAFLALRKAEFAALLDQVCISVASLAPPRTLIMRFRL